MLKTVVDQKDIEICKTLIPFKNQFVLKFQIFKY